EGSPVDHLARLMPDAPETAVRARLGRFGFGQEKGLVKARDLSGGEKARLTFAIITFDAPSLLILDEPTNHLDIDPRDPLMAAPPRAGRGGAARKPRRGEAPTSARTRGASGLCRWERPAARAAAPPGLACQGNRSRGSELVGRRRGPRPRSVGNMTPNITQHC